MSKTLAKSPDTVKASRSAPAGKAAGKSSASSAAASTLPPVTNRFAQRFSPPKPAPRGAVEPAAGARAAAKPDPKLANAWKTKSGRELSEAELLAMPDSEYMG